MALNKSQTSLWMKVLIIALAIMMAMLVLLPGITSLMTPSNIPAGQSSTTTSGTPSATSYEGIAQQFAGQIQANEAALAKSPKDFDLLVKQANTYFDWALTVRQTQALASQGLDQPLWKSAVADYQRALAVNAKFNPAVMTDYAVALHYSGNDKAAIAMVAAVLKQQPDFPQAVLNRGVFAESSNDTATAIAYYGKFVKLNPKDEASSVTFAKGRVAALQGLRGFTRRLAPARRTSTRYDTVSASRSSASESELAVEKMPLSLVSDRMLSTVSLVMRMSRPPWAPYSLESESSSPSPELSRYSSPARSTIVDLGDALRILSMFMRNAAHSL
jgi:tetratricopeptide (TPR) repeat protein